MFLFPLASNSVLYRPVSSSFSLLSVRRLWLLRTLFLEKNCIGSEVASMKIAFFAILAPTWTHILAPTGSNMGFLKQNFNFQSLRKTEAILLPIMKLQD